MGTGTTWGVSILREGQAVVPSISASVDDSSQLVMNRENVLPCVDLVNLCPRTVRDFTGYHSKEDIREG